MKIVWWLITASLLLTLNVPSFADEMTKKTSNQPILYKTYHYSAEHHKAVPKANKAKLHPIRRKTRHSAHRVAQHKVTRTERLQQASRARARKKAVARRPPAAKYLRLVSSRNFKPIQKKAYQKRATPY